MAFYVIWGEVIHWDRHGETSSSCKVRFWQSRANFQDSHRHKIVGQRAGIPRQEKRPFTFYQSLVLAVTNSAVLNRCLLLEHAYTDRQTDRHRHRDIEQITQWLRVYIILPQNLSLVPRTHARQLTTASTSSSKNVSSPYSPHSHEYPNVYIINLCTRRQS